MYQDLDAREASLPWLSPETGEVAAAEEREVDREIREGGGRAETRGASSTGPVSTDQGGTGISVG